MTTMLKLVGFMARLAIALPLAAVILTSVVVFFLLERPSGERDPGGRAEKKAARRRLKAELLFGAAISRPRPKRGRSFGAPSSNPQGLSLA